MVNIENELAVNDYLFTAAENAFRQRVKVFLGQYTELYNHGQGEIDPRSVYQLLGQQKLLAPQWPENYGGQNKTIIEMAIVVEEMVRANIPETLFILSIQIVGNLIFQLGTVKQKLHWLPGLARGECFAGVLFSEINAGSDLAALETQALQISEDCYEITGKKIYALKTRFCDFGLCATRTTNNIGSKYDGITVFMVPLNAVGILITEISSMADEPFYEVSFDKVKISKENIIGKLNHGWHVISQTLMLERTGLDCILKASSGLNLIASCGVKEQQLNSLYSKMNAARMMCYSLLRQYSHQQTIPQAKSAIAKWYASNLAIEVMECALKDIDLHNSTTCDTIKLTQLSSMYRDIPGTTLAAGSSEMMLEIIASSKFDFSKFRPVQNSIDDDLLYEKFREVFAKQSQKLSDELFALIKPKQKGGMDLGLNIAALMCEVAGNLGSDDDIIKRLLAINDNDSSNQVTSLKNIYYAAYWLGLAQKSCELAVERISTRMQFQTKIIDYQAARFNLATRVAEITTAKYYLNYAIWAVENKIVESLVITKTALNITKDAVFSALTASLHLHGAYGLTQQAEIQKLYRWFVLQNTYVNKILCNPVQYCHVKSC